MARVIEELQDMTAEGQEFVLGNLAKEYEPIQIDDVVYYIPPAVQNLISDLHKQIRDAKISSK